MATATETPLYFPGRDADLFGVLHEPAAVRAPAFVFCHPFGEEKLWAHRVFVGMARELAERGRVVLRFDYRGNGDSGGEVSQTSIESNLEDIGTAIDFVKRRSGATTVGLIGLRLGATAAALAAERRTDISAIVLWQPVVDGARYAQELLRVNLTTQLAVNGEVTADREALVARMHAGQTVNVDGYELAAPFYDQLSAIRLAGLTPAFAGRCLIVHIDRNPGAAPGRDLVELQKAYADASLEVVGEEPFWKEIKRFYDRAEHLSAATMTWLDA